MLLWSNTYVIYTLETTTLVLVGLMWLWFWIVNAREVARRVVRNCVHCVRYKPKLLQQVMGNLPVERLTL